MIAVLKHLGSVGSRHSCVDRSGVSHPSELYRVSNRTQVSIDDKGRPLAQLRRVGERRPKFFRRVAQFADKDERPLGFIWSILFYLRPVGRTRRVWLEIGHLRVSVTIFPNDKGFKLIISQIMSAQ